MGMFTNLPSDLMHYFINNVDQDLDFVDKVRIRAVCSSWNSLLPPIPKLLSENLPWMLQQDSTKGASMYNPHEHETYPLDLPEIKNKVFKGSSHGWIVTLDDTNGGIDDICLFNPLTRVQIQLPPRSTFPDIVEFHPDIVGKEYLLKDTSTPEDGEINAGFESGKECVNLIYIDKVVLSSSPNNSHCIAVAIYGEYSQQLAWCRLHDKKWTPLTEYSSEGGIDGFFEIIFHNGKLHALHRSGKLVVYDTIDPEVSFTEIVKEVPESTPEVALSNSMYLVDCSNLGILLVSREVDYDSEEKVCSVETSWFNIHKLVDSPSDGSKSWVTIEDIGENMLFLGLNSSLSIPISDKLESLGYKRKCIYYADDYRVFRGKCMGYDQEDSDIGMFDAEDESTNILPGFDCEFKLFWPPPIWSTPSGN